LTVYLKLPLRGKSGEKSAVKNNRLPPGGQGKLYFDQESKIVLKKSRCFAILEGWKNERDSRMAQQAELARLIGEYRGGVPGPRVIFLGGVHGNEPAGIIALERVLSVLHAAHPPFRGKMLALRGNLAALARSSRYVDEDLNRIWTLPRLNALAECPRKESAGTAEEKEQRELFRILQPILHDCSAPVYLVDLHTTSSESPPFLILADTIRNRKLARQVPAPLILGMEELLEGTILNYVGDLGISALAFEAGQHGQQRSVEHHVAAIWILLSAAGCLSAAHVPGFEAGRALLAESVAGLSRVFEVRFRYGVQAGEEFRMEPGYRNFRKIKRGETLARSRAGAIRSPFDGHIFMPLYQSQGNDGFFVIRPVASFRLKLSEWLRRLKIDKLLPFLPGISRNPSAPDEVTANPLIARWYVPEVFHLLGYRKTRIEGRRLIFVKHRYDLYGPEKEQVRSKKWQVANGK